MSKSFDDYVAALDELRILRARGEDSDEAENRLSDHLEALWYQLDNREQARARALSWRAWPDLYERKLLVRDRDVWDESHSAPAREAA